MALRVNFEDNVPRVALGKRAAVDEWTVGKQNSLHSVIAREIFKDRNRILEAGTPAEDRIVTALPWGEQAQLTSAVCH